MSEWISVEKRLPELERSVLVHNNLAPGNPSGYMESCEDYNTSVAARWGETEDEWEWVCYMSMIEEPRCGFTPTHWMPLPEPPAGQNV